MVLVHSSFGHRWYPHLIYILIVINLFHFVSGVAVFLGVVKMVFMRVMLVRLNFLS